MDVAIDGDGDGDIEIDEEKVDETKAELNEAELRGVPRRRLRAEVQHAVAVGVHVVHILHCVPEDRNLRRGPVGLPARERALRLYQRMQQEN